MTGVQTCALPISTDDYDSNARDTQPDIGAFEYPTFSVSGAVSGVVSSGVLITITRSGYTDTATTTGAGYSFDILLDGATYLLTPTLAGYEFTPSSTLVTINGSNAVQNFISAVTSSPIYSISGHIEDTMSANLAGVSVVLSHGASTIATVITNSDGDYVFSTLSNGTYTVEPEYAGYTFAPAIRTEVVAGASITSANFTGTLITYNISGTIIDGASGLAGVQLILSGASLPAETSNGAGAFTFTDVPPGSYTITPSLTGYSFTPISIEIGRASCRE